MLRSEHVLARLSRGRLVPHRLRPDDERVREVARALLELHTGRIGGSRSLLERELQRLEEELGPRLDPRRGFKVVRALAKLLEERAAWTPPTEADPYALRTRLFELAAALPEPPTGHSDLLAGDLREELLDRIAAETGVEDPVALMYADRRGEAVLADLDVPAPEELVERYNVAQIQGVLYAATGLTVELAPGADARLVFRYVKLLGLMYALEPLPGVDGGHRLRLDGPLSLFGGTRKYGLRLAKLLPALLLTGPWTLEADLVWKGRDAKLVLDSETCALKSHYRGPADIGEADVREAFIKAFARAKSTGGWELRPAPGVLPLPRLGAALVPDFALLNRETGEEAHLEILGLYSERYLISHLKLVREAASRGHRLLLAAPEALDASPEALSEASLGAVIPFKTRPDPKAVLAALEG